MVFLINKVHGQYNITIMVIKPIKTEQDYEQAMKRLEQIFDAKKGTKEGDELEILGILIENYENEHFLLDNL